MAQLGRELNISFKFCITCVNFSGTQDEDQLVFNFIANFDNDDQESIFRPLSTKFTYPVNSASIQQRQILYKFCT